MGMRSKEDLEEEVVALRNAIHQEAGKTGELLVKMERLTDDLARVKTMNRLLLEKLKELGYE